MAVDRSWKQRLSSVLLIPALIASMLVVTEAPAAALDVVIDDFENPSDPGIPCGDLQDGIPLGFCTFNGGGDVVSISNATDGAAPTESVLEMDVDVTGFAGFIRGFTNQTGDTWVSQNWSTREGLSLHFRGTGSGSAVFIDILENRNEDSTTDDAQRWTVEFTDDFTGWQLLEFPFSDFTEKNVGNGAPTDGFDRFEVHGWAVGTLGTGGPRTFAIDEVGLYGEVEPPALSIGFGSANFDIAEGSTGDILVELNRPMNETDPSMVSVDYFVEELTPIPGREYTPTSGTITFANGGDREATFSLETFDDAKYEPDERVILRLSDPVSVELGAAQASATIVDDDPFDPLLLDDFEMFPHLWEANGSLTLSNPELASGDMMALPEQGDFESALQIDVIGSMASTNVIEALSALAQGSDEQTAKQIEDAITRIEQSLDPDYWIGGYLLEPTQGKHVFDRQAQAVSELAKVVRSGGPQAGQAQDAIDQIVDLAAGLAAFSIELAELNDASAKDLDGALREVSAAASDLDSSRPGQAIRHYRNAWMTATGALDVDSSDIEALIVPDLGAVTREFPMGQDWSSSESLSFWYFGQNSGDAITFELLDNRVPDPGPSGWSLAWSDEFDEPAGTAPNPDNWGYENGDGTINGIPGWGNSELQYYTDRPDNVSTDGEGNLVITAREADGELCYYGPCDYTSARLVSKNRAEFAYGKIESRILVPDGEAGLWPAFWSLGTDIDIVTWPQTGEIDIMEYVSREPDEVFGTIHGPGYSGGGAFGDFYTFAEPVADDYHTFTIEWQPDLITWYVDDILYHTATPEDVPGEWVFNDPVYLLLNLALGGNFGGSLSPDLTFPQEMKVDYVRVYQAPDTAERFEASFVDEFEGWQLIEVPFTSLARSDEQPDGAPDDGLNLTEVWGYGFSVPGTTSLDELWIDQVRLVDTTPPSVTITDDVVDEFATGDVTFTFAFSEDVGTSFTADDISLAGGEKGAFERVDGRLATLVARPPADSSSVLEVSVAPDSFIDLAGNSNVAGASATQSYDTPPPPGGPVVIDDFEGPFGWGFFNGNQGGGGGGLASDRPKEGASYMSTGWGGSGDTAGFPGFYGGGFKTFPDNAQVAPPADPWFNVWVFNQSDATADQYTLEITVREDLAGDGWDGFGNANGDESFRLDTVFPATSFNDEWTLLSAPLSDFDLVDGTGGNTTFDGNLDELVIVVAGVTGPDGSTVEADFDYFAFTSGGPLEAPPPSGPVVIDDFEGPFGWGFFNGNQGGGGGGLASDRPKEGASYLSTGWGGSGDTAGFPGFYGGGFKTFPDNAQVAPPADPWFNVWVFNQSDATADQYTLEITVREDLAGDGWDGFGNANGDESFRLDTVFPATSFNDEWTLLSAPLSDFDLVDGTGGNTTFDGNLDELVIVVAGVTGPDGSTVEADFDYFAFTSGGPLEAPPPGTGFEITFDETAQARLEPFEGLEGSVVPDPGDASNNVASLTKPSTAQPWAGTLIYTQDSPAFSIPQIAFSESATTVSLRFWSERPAGIPVMLKVENSGDPGQFREVTVNTTTSGEWETLSFDFAGLDTSLVWDKVAIFPDFFTSEHPGGDYFVDDITFP